MSMMSMLGASGGRIVGERSAVRKAKKGYARRVLYHDSTVFGSVVGMLFGSCSVVVASVPM